MLGIFCTCFCGSITSDRKKLSITVFNFGLFLKSQGQRPNNFSPKFSQWKAPTYLSCYKVVFVHSIFFNFLKILSARWEEESPLLSFQRGGFFKENVISETMCTVYISLNWTNVMVERSLEKGIFYFHIVTVDRYFFLGPTRLWTPV